MKTHPSDIHLLKLIQDNGTLEIWTNHEPRRYHAGTVFIGSEGDKDPQTVQELISSGYLKKISEATNCHLYQVTDKGQAVISNAGLM